METWLLLAMGAAALALLLVLAAIRRRPAAKKRRIPALILEKEQDGDTFLFLLETAEGTLHQPVPPAVYQAFHPGDRGELILWGKECMGFVKNP